MTIYIGLGLTILLAGSENVEAARVVGNDFDLGLVPANSTVRHQFWIKPGPGDTLMISEVKTCCGCRAVWSNDDRISEGDSTSVVLFWSTRGYKGWQTSSAYLYWSGQGMPEELRMTGKIVTTGATEASIDWSPAAVRFERGASARSSVERVRLSNWTGTGAGLRLVESGPEIAVQAPDSIGMGSEVDLEVTRSDESAEGKFETSFTLELDGNNIAPIRVSIPVRQGDFSFRPEFTTKK